MLAYLQSVRRFVTQPLLITINKEGHRLKIIQLAVLVFAIIGKLESSAFQIYMLLGLVHKIHEHHEGCILQL
jgi:hypothetical protein